MAHIPKIDEANLQAICDILGDTNTGLTGPEIGRYLRECGCPDPIPYGQKTHPCLLNVLIGGDLDQLRFPLMPACFSEPHNS